MCVDWSQKHFETFASDWGFNQLTKEFSSRLKIKIKESWENAISEKCVATPFNEIFLYAFKKMPTPAG